VDREINPSSVISPGLFTWDFIKGERVDTLDQLALNHADADADAIGLASID
jgi:hypothetical protein